MLAKTPPPPLLLPNALVLISQNQVCGLFLRGKEGDDFNNIYFERCSVSTSIDVTSFYQKWHVRKCLPVFGTVY